MVNPFAPLDVIDKPDQLFGRSKEIKTIFEFLHGGCAVNITGTYGVEKTSLIKVLLQQAEKELNRQPVYVNLLGLGSEEEFFHTLCYEIGVEDSIGYSFSRSIKDKRILLAIDESQNTDAFTTAAQLMMRALSEGTNAPIKLVYSSTKPLTHDAEIKGSHLAGISIDLELQCWDEKICRDFVDYHLDGTLIDFSEAEIVDLISRSKGHPKTFKTLCYWLTKEKYEAK